MKILITFLIAIGLSMFSIAQPPKVSSNKGKVFGIPTNATGAILASNLVSMSDKQSQSITKITGKVIEVCKAEGCWIKMETSSKPIMIKMKNHSFMVPLGLNNKNIVAQGVITIKETTVEMQKHYAQDAGKSKAEIVAIKFPVKELTMEASGILVL